MHARESLFTRLSKYAASEKTRPLENFTSELLAWLICSWPDFGRAIAVLYLPSEGRRAKTIEATTQRPIRGGFVDVSIVVGSEDGRPIELLLENKVEAGIGDRTRRSGPNDESPAVAGRPGARSSYTQIDAYLAFARKSTKDVRVSLLTKDPVPLVDEWTQSHWAKPHHWCEVYSVTESLIPDARMEHRFLGEQVLQFLEEVGMKLEPVTDALLAGTPQRVRLIALMKQAASLIGVELRELHISLDRSGSDQWGPWVSWKDQDGALAGLGYSDSRAELALYLDDRRFGKEETLTSLRSSPDLVGLTKDGKFWGYPHKKLIELDRDFFSLGGNEQVVTIAGKAKAMLRAVVAASGSI